MINESIRNYVETNLISQRTLALKAGLNSDTLSKVLNGKRRLLADEYIRICDALCVPYDLFVRKTS